MTPKLPTDDPGVARMAAVSGGRLLVKRLSSARSENYSDRIGELTLSEQVAVDTIILFSKKESVFAQSLFRNVDRVVHKC